MAVAREIAGRLEVGIRATGASENRTPAQSLMLRLLELPCHLPWITFALFCTVVVRARVVTGEWPRPRYYGFEEPFTFIPETIDPNRFGAHYDAVWWLAVGCVWALVGYTPLFALLRWQGVPVRLRRLGLFLGFQAVLALMVISTIYDCDPTGFAMWFVD